MTHKQSDGTRVEQITPLSDDDMILESGGISGRGYRSRMAIAFVSGVALGAAVVGGNWYDRSTNDISDAVAICAPCDLYSPDTGLVDEDQPFDAGLTDVGSVDAGLPDGSYRLPVIPEGKITSPIDCGAYGAEIVSMYPQTAGDFIFCGKDEIGSSYFVISLSEPSSSRDIAYVWNNQDKMPKDCGPINYSSVVATADQSLGGGLTANAGDPINTQIVLPKDSKAVVITDCEEVPEERRQEESQQD
jgi:hypothetical protein